MFLNNDIAKETREVEVLAKRAMLLSSFKEIHQQNLRFILKGLKIHSDVEKNDLIREIYNLLRMGVVMVSNGMLELVENIYTDETVEIELFPLQSFSNYIQEIHKDFAKNIKELEEDSQSNSEINIVPDHSLMIVEDDPDLQQFYTAFFQKTHWRILTQIENGIIAKKHYHKLVLKPSVIMIDIELPGCSGFSVARDILRHNSNQKIVFLSGRNNFMSDSSIPTDLRTIPRISKPFNFNDLIIVLTKLVSSD
jgi:CheY-like chemotaxis protein